MADGAARGVIFDMDGVLVDSGALHLEAWKRMAAKLGIELDGGFFRDTFGMSNRQFVPLFLGREAEEAEVEAVADEKEAMFRDLARGTLGPLPGAIELARALRADGWKLAVGTGAPPENAELILEEIGILPMLDVLVHSGHYHEGKPHPQVYTTCSEQLTLAPERLLVIEDAAVGVTAAHRAGMACLAVTNTLSRERLAEAELVVDSLEELSPKLLADLLSNRWRSGAGREPLRQ